jgi:hypothetical protein
MLCVSHLVEKNVHQKQVRLKVKSEWRHIANPKPYPLHPSRVVVAQSV